MSRKPHGSYVGLFGSFSGNWRSRCINALEREGLAFLDPTDPAWEDINSDNGDEKQNVIDELVR